MLKQYSWQGYFYVLTVAGTIYYFIATLLLYHKEIIAVFTGKNLKPKPATQSEEMEDVQEIMGKIDEGVQQNYPDVEEEVEEQERENHAMQAMEVIPPGMESPAIVGSVSDLLQETKALLIASLANKSDKTEILRLLSLLLERYRKIGETQYRDSVNLYIYHSWNEHLAIQIDVPEIAMCWPSAKAE